MTARHFTKSKHNLYKSGTAFEKILVKINFMGFDKQAMLRYFLINFRLKQSPAPTTEDLRAYVEKEFCILSIENIIINRATIKSDIRVMKKVLFAPITFSFNANCYQYEHNSSAFIKMPQLATEYFWNFLRLQYLLGPIYYSQEFIIYNNSEIAGNEKLPVFVKALKEQNQISFTFRPFNGKRSFEIILNPFVLREQRKAWYIIGTKLDGELRSYPIHRIEGESKILSDQSQIPEGFQYQTKEHSFNSLGAKPIDILLDCKPEYRNKIYSNTIHSSQKVVSNNSSGLRLTLNAIPDEELISKLLSYRNLIEVISPEKLRAFIAEEIRIMLIQYEGSRA